MFITTCNRFFHKHQRLTFIVIGFMIIVPFVLLWGPGDFLSRGGGRFRAGEVGKMYGKTIRQDAFMGHLAAVRLQFFQAYGGIADFDSQYRDLLTLQALQRMRLIHEAQKAGILDDVTDAEVLDAIQNFRVQGRFLFRDESGKYDGNLVEVFRKSMLAPRLGLTGPGFDEIIRENIAIERLRKAVMNQAQKPADKDVADQFQRAYTRYQVQVCEFKPEGFKKEAESAATDAAVREFYAKNVEIFRPMLGKSSLEGLLSDGSTAEAAERYLTPYVVPELKKLRVAAFAAAAYRPEVKVTDAQVQAYYDQHKAEFDAQVKASHILLRVAPGATAAEKTAKWKQLEEIRAKVIAGAKFEDMAAQYSEDPGSKALGGDLGFFGRGDMVKPFEDAAFALKKDGLSGIVESKYGLHLIKCVDTKPARDPAVAKAEIAETLAAAAASKLAQKAADKFCDDVYRATIDKSDRVAVSEVQKEFSARALAGKIVVKETGWVRGDKATVEPLGEEPALAQESGRLSAATAQQALSEVIPGSDGKAFYVACFLDAQPARLPAIDEAGILAQVRTQFVAEKETELAQAAARKMVGELNGKLDQKTDFTTAAAALKLAFQEVKPFSAAERPAGADLKGLDVSSVLNQMPAATEGRVMPVFATSSGAVLVYYKEKTAPTAAEFEVKKAELRGRLEEWLQNMAWSGFLQKIEAESNTELAEAWKPKVQPGIGSR